VVTEFDFAVLLTSQNGFVLLIFPPTIYKYKNHSYFVDCRKTRSKLRLAHGPQCANTHSKSVAFIPSESHLIQESKKGGRPWDSQLREILSLSKLEL
jgi:hypothetical protein